MDLPCCFAMGALCCIGGTSKITAVTKTGASPVPRSAAAASVVALPASQHSVHWLRSCEVHGNPEGRTVDKCTCIAAKSELDTYQVTLLRRACYCCFQGFTYDMSPCWQNDGKVCCFTCLACRGCWGPRPTEMLIYGNSEARATHNLRSPASRAPL